MLPVPKDSEALNRLMQSLNNEFPAPTAVHSAVHSAAVAARPAPESRHIRSLNRMQPPEHQEYHALHASAAQNNHDNTPTTWSFSDAPNNLWGSFGSALPQVKSMPSHHPAQINLGCNGLSTEGSTASASGNNAVVGRAFEADCGEPQSYARPHMGSYSHRAKQHPEFVEGRFSSRHQQPLDGRQGLCQLLDLDISQPMVITQPILHAQLPSVGHGLSFQQQSHEQIDLPESWQQSRFSDQLPAIAVSPPPRQQGQLAATPTSAERLREPLSQWDMDAAVKRVRRRLTPVFDRSAARDTGCPPHRTSP